MRIALAAATAAILALAASHPGPAAAASGEAARSGAGTPDTGAGLAAPNSSVMGGTGIGSGAGGMHPDDNLPPGATASPLTGGARADSGTIGRTSPTTPVAPAGQANRP